MKITETQLAVLAEEATRDIRTGEIEPGKMPVGHRVRVDHE